MTTIGNEWEIIQRNVQFKLRGAFRDEDEDDEDDGNALELLQKDAFMI